MYHLLDGRLTEVTTMGELSLGWYYFLQLFGDFGYWPPYNWLLNGGLTVIILSNFSVTMKQ